MSFSTKRSKYSCTFSSMILNPVMSGTNQTLKFGDNECKLTLHWSEFKIQQEIFHDEKWSSISIHDKTFSNKVLKALVFRELIRSEYVNVIYEFSQEDYFYYKLKFDTE